MKASIKTQLLVMCILLVLVTTLSISIAYYVLAKQEKHRESQQRLQIAFEIILDNLNRQSHVYVQRIEDYLQRDETFQTAANMLLQDQNPLERNVGFRPFLVTQLAELKHVIAVDRLGLYLADGQVLAVYPSPPSFSPQHITSIRAGDHIFDEDPSTNIAVNLFRDDLRLGFRLTAPFFRGSEMTGMLIAEVFLTQSMLEHYRTLSKTEINFFAGEQFSLGTLAEQDELPSARLGQLSTCHGLLQDTHIELVSVRLSGHDYYQSGCSLTDDRATLGAITVSLSQDIEKQAIRKILTTVFIIAGTGVVVCFIFVSGVVVPTFTRPIIRLTRATSDIAKGHLQQAINTSRHDELGELARSFASMRDEIQKKISELQELNEKLEQRVKDRTSEIARQNAEIVRQKYLLDTFMETVPNQIYFKDCEGRITKANLAHAKRFGFSHPSEEIGKTDFDFYPQEKAAKHYAEEQEIIRTGQPVINQEVSSSRPDGTVTWSLMTKMPLRNEHGEILGIFGISRDITELKQAQQELAHYRDGLEELVEERTAELVRINDRLQQEISKRNHIENDLRLSEKQYRMLAENVVDGVVIIQKGRLVFSNAGFAAMLHTPQERLLNQDIIDLFHQQSRALAQERVCAAFPDNRWQAQLVTRDQRTLWGEVDQTAITWDGNPACLLTIRDITERKLRETHLETERARLQQENITLRSTVAERYKFGGLVGKSPAMQQIYELIVSAAASEVNVLICGESGTGKELIAQTIHQVSQRKDKPFVPVNCASIPETLFEREFFGHRKGAFTGADQNKPGLFDLAHQGTLFLDEVTELSSGMQAKLLRVLQDGEYFPLGSPESKQADVVIVAATNRDWNPLIQQGDLRQDFFYRICVIEIQSPPLRDRKEDLPLLIEFFLERYRRKHERLHKDVPSDLPVDLTMLPPDVLRALYEYDWPGNVRELQNTLQRYLATHRLDLKAALMARRVHSRTITEIGLDLKKMTLPEATQTLEKYMITDVLARHAHHRLNTAKTLGITRRALQYKLKKYGLLNDAERPV